MRIFGRPSFSGHESFPFRYSWLKKAVDAVLEDGKALSREDAFVALGVGKNMAASMRHWALTVRAIEEDTLGPLSGRRGGFRVTEFGHRLLADDGWDPYLEHPGTLWLLHWRLVTAGDHATTWWWAFNHYTATEFDRQSLVSALSSFCQERGWKQPSPGTLKRDVDCFVRTYVAPRLRRSVPEETLDCPLVELRLILPGTTADTYILPRAPRPDLPDAVFTFALAEYIQRAGGRTISAERLLFGAGLPGRVFRMSEDDLLARCERLDALTGGCIVFDETAGVRQVIVRSSPDPLAILADYYERPGPVSLDLRRMPGHEAL